MLHAVRLHDFRSFADSNRIELAEVNVFIGPNSAGKTNIMTAIELALLSTGSTAPGSRRSPGRRSTTHGTNGSP